MKRNFFILFFIYSGFCIGRRMRGKQAPGAGGAGELRSSRSRGKRGRGDTVTH
jgi:hypothetical protein